MSSVLIAVICVLALAMGYFGFQLNRYMSRRDGEGGKVRRASSVDLELGNHGSSDAEAMNFSESTEEVTVSKKVRAGGHLLPWPRRDHGECDGGLTPFTVPKHTRRAP